MLEKLPDGTSRKPKVPLTDDWLEWKNFCDYNVPFQKRTFFNVMCTPYMYNKCTHTSHHAGNGCVRTAAAQSLPLTRCCRSVAAAAAADVSLAWSRRA